MIFFVTLSISGREFNDPQYAEASNAEQAGNKAKNFIKRTLGLNAEVTGISLALRQRRQRYSDPRSIL